MFRLITLILFLLTNSFVTANELITLCYHDVRDDVVGILDKDQTAVSSKNLAIQFAWLKEHGYNVVSIQDVVDAKTGSKELPPKAVLLSFDDGYRSFYTRIYPLLKLFNYPAVFALTTKWLEETNNNKILYGQTYRDRDEFLTWDQIREMSASGLIEIASHSHDLHRGIIGNPQNNSQPAMITRLYDNKTTQYESDADYKTRIYQDLKQSSDIIYQKINKRPRIIVWPYGAFSQHSQNIAAELGLTIGLTLSDHKQNKAIDLAQIPRHLISANPSIADFADSIRKPYDDDNEIHRVAHIDIDTIYDPNDNQQTLRNLDGLLDRIKAMNINTVYLQAFADPDGDGNADALYFPNRHLPMRADLFNRIAWQLRTRAKVTIYAWLPVTAFSFKTIPILWKVQEWREGKRQDSNNNYQRLSFFNPEVKRVIGEIYEDIAKYSNFGGILFHDDALLGDYEDASFFAEIYAQSHQLPPFKILYENREQRIRWAKLKTDALIEFTQYLANKVRIYRPEIKTARNIYAQPVINPETEEWYAQSFEKFLQYYDYTAIMAMPYMEQAENPQQWLEALIAKVKTYPHALKKTIFELQTVNWHTQEKIPDEILELQMRLLIRKGAVQFGYYPDDSIKNHPKLKMLQRIISLKTFPYGD
jgi:biofilm PGA synthesis lipoprotein PgaB